MSVAEFRGGSGPGDPPEDYDAIFGGPPGNTPSRADRTPPSDHAAEQSVLGAMLLSKDAIADVVEAIRGVDFYRPAHEVVYDAIIDLYGRGEPADAVTVAAELQRRGDLDRVGGAPYLHDLVAGVPIAANAGYYAEIVREKAILRRLVDAGTKIAQLGYAAEGQVDDVVDRAQAEVYSVTERRTSEDYQPLSELMAETLDEIEAINAHDGGLAGVPTGFADLDDLTNGLHAGQMVIVAARPAIGKALALDTPLPTPTGWTTMGDVDVGDYLVDADGRPTRVVAATEVMADRPCYEVVFKDGETLVADGQHQWLTWDRRARRSASEPRYAKEPVLPAVRTTEEIARTLRCGTADARLNHTIMVGAPFELPEAELPIPPYTLGAWLGDGHSAGGRITSFDPEIITRIETDGLVVHPHGGCLYGLAFPTDPPRERVCLACGVAFLPANNEQVLCGRGHGGFVPRPKPSCTACGGRARGSGPLCRRCRDAKTFTGRLRGLGVLGNKHIPPDYLRASEQQRRDLLAGLLDTDGFVAEQGNVQFAVTNRRLAEGALELVRTLGYRATMRTKRVQGRSEASSVCYMVNFTPGDKVFHLPRKAARQVIPGVTVRHRPIEDVRPIPSVPVRCVQVDNADSLYLAGRSMVPTHNSTLGLDVCRAASIKHGLTSVIFSLEMSRTEITMRLLSAEARIAMNHMRNGHMTDDDWSRLARKMGEVSSAPLFIDDSPNLTMMEIRAKARRLKQRQDLRLIVVDYLQLLSSGKRVESRQVEVSEFSRQMKLLAKELEVPIVAIAQLNRGAEQRTDKRPMLSDLRESGCLTAETRLLRADTGAEISLGELLASDVRGIPVWALDDRLKLVPRTLSHAFPSGTKEVFRVRLASGREVEASANHPFLTYKGWQQLGDLSVGSRVGVPRHVPAPLEATPWDEDEVVLLAHLIGDGSFVRRQPIRYASIDEANLAAVGDAAARRFGITPVRDDYAAARVTTLRLPAPYRLTHGKRNPIAAWLDGLGLFDLRSHEKFVPDGVFGLPKCQVALFLRHLWATDGSVRWDDKVGQARVYYASTSRRLVDDVARLLLRCNVFSRIKRVTKKGYRDSWHLYIYGSDNQKRFCEEIGVHGRRAASVSEILEQLDGRKVNTNLDTVPTDLWERVRAALREKEMTHREFAAAMNIKFCGSTLWKHAPSRPRLAKVATLLDDADLEMLATNDIFWDEIAEIESVGEREVYDATVLGFHNFVANGIALHNSLEQDADVVILLHRDDAYDRDSTRPGEADLIVAKHRAGPTDTVVVAFQGHYSRFVDMQQA